MQFLNAQALLFLACYSLLFRFKAAIEKTANKYRAKDDIKIFTLSLAG